jgi:hypothetical protein
MAFILLPARHFYQALFPGKSILFSEFHLQRLLGDSGQSHFSPEFAAEAPPVQHRSKTGNFSVKALTAIPSATIKKSGACLRD